ncbi:NT-3 growth factor receptor [Triplophysa tibetana]|uniref:NT-3 growth factor receptor n=1 Tax=Triplophysa tibetana TaxID=1572043 RepID=A0A5A9PQU6_9TELE|nr:NT-3 growth factor receptor [Triplophysa tibetana]
MPYFEPDSYGHIVKDSQQISVCFPVFFSSSYWKYWLGNAFVVLIVVGDMPNAFSYCCFFFARKLEGVLFNCSCNIRWIQLWQQRGESELHNQQLYCYNGYSKISLQQMNISQCDLPEISVSHSNLTVIEGDSITVTCNGSGVPVPEVDWTVNGLHSINTHQSNQYPPNVHSINLTLVNVSRDDNSFMLTCIAENIVGMTNSSIQLSVQFPPVIIKFEEPERWHDTCMIFTVRGQPLPTLRWFYKGEEIKQSEYIRPDMETYQDNREGCLMFQNPTHHNNGNYTLEASNFLGVAVKTVYAHFLKPPFEGMYIKLNHTNCAFQNSTLNQITIKQLFSTCAKIARLPSSCTRSKSAFPRLELLYRITDCIMCREKEETECWLEALSNSRVSPTPTAIPTMTHRPEDDTFGVSIAVGLAGFACVLLVVMFVLINKYGRRSKFGMKVRKRDSVQGKRKILQEHIMTPTGRAISEFSTLPFRQLRDSSGDITSEEEPGKNRGF